MELSVSHIDLSLGATRKELRPVLSDVTFAVADGAFCSLLGESGAGKSTILKVIAGILLQDGGEIRFDGRVVDGLAAHRRNLGFVFQDVRLFPHMTVEENVAYPLRMAGMGKRARLSRAAELLERVQLAGFGPRPVQTLSGGQAQRVALARAIAPKPAALLLDEPFSGLDESLRDDMRSLLLRLHREEGITTLMVTHDANEALMMSDSIVALDGGRVMQVATPEELYRCPATAKIAACFGVCSTLTGIVEGGVFSVAGIALPAEGVPDGPAEAVVRQDGCSISDAGCDEGMRAARGDRAASAASNGELVDAGRARVRCGVFAGGSYLARLDIEGQTLTVPVAQLPAAGTEVSVAAPPESFFVYARP